MFASNVVDEKTLKEVQLNTLKFISNVLSKTFGPNGSTTVIKKNPTSATKYTKDGHSVLKELVFNGMIENTTAEELVELTRHIVVTVGDGTTSAIILSYLIYKELLKFEDEYQSFEIIDRFQKCASKISDIIRSHSNGEPSLEDIYNISMISTNSNKEISDYLVQLYKEFGNEVYIEVGISNDSNTKIKAYDGMTLETGYSNPCFINNKKGTCELRNPKIFTFKDPVDTEEMITLFNEIIKQNIINPVNKTNDINSCIPTVILCPRLSRDMSSILEYITEIMNQTKYPLLVISNITDTDELDDITKLCGGRQIKKYIDTEIQKKEIEEGLAPTPETINFFAGSADMIVSDAVKTKFINPSKMYDENHEYSDVFKGLLDALEGELTRQKENNANVNTIGNLKRRINSLKANMVDLLIGGVTLSDRDAIRDLAEDAVLCCRSAASYGVGYGANFEALRAVTEELQHTQTVLDRKIYNVIKDSYHVLSDKLYDTAQNPEINTENALKNGKPFNLTNSNRPVLTSIESDITILETVSKIVTLMVTSNQFILPDPVLNTYVKNV